MRPQRCWFVLRLVPLLALVAFAAFVGAGGATNDAEAASVGVGSCTTVGSCDGNTGDIGANSCNGVNACDGNTGTIGDNSCNGDSACVNNSVGGAGTVGDGSCNGGFACLYNGRNGSGTVGNGSCTGDYACYYNGRDGSGTVGDGSCNDAVADGGFACRFNGFDGGVGSVGDGSCNGNQACEYNGEFGTGTVGDGSCNGTQACFGNGADGTGAVGDGSCIGDYACDGNGDGVAGSVGDNSCNGEPQPGQGPGAGQCPAATTANPPGVGDCAENLPGFEPPICLGPILTVTYTDESTGLPYVPGAWTRGPVTVRFFCTASPYLSPLSPIPAGAAHNDSGAGNTYPASVRVTRTTSLALSSRWRCLDSDGNVADAPAGFPAIIRIDRRAPSCTVVVSRTSVPRNGTPTLVTATVNGTDADSGVASRRIIAISPAPLSGDALPDASPGTWTLVGASGKVFTFTGEVRDNAGNVKTCTTKVVSR